MKLVEKNYIGSKKSMIKTLKVKGIGEIGMLASCGSVPIAIVCLWYLENVGQDPAVKEQLDRVYEFYGYTEIERV